MGAAESRPEYEPMSEDEKEIARQVLDFTATALDTVSDTLREASTEIKREKSKIDEVPTLEHFSKRLSNCDETCQSMEELRACYQRVVAEKSQSSKRR